MMMMKDMSVCLASSILMVVGCTLECKAMPGGYAAEPVTNRNVVAAAQFAVKTQERGMQGKKGTQPVKLKLVKILSAQQQVVAGMNFRLNVQVNVNDTKREAEVVVWWQAWRKPDPYRLTSWNWKRDKKQNKPDAGDGK
jgi:hypothetical protein